MTAAKTIAETARNIAKRLFDRRIKLAHGPSGAGQSIDPHSILSRLERLSANATLLILAGILVEILFILCFPHDIPTIVSTVIANGAIGVGLVIEYFCILGTIVASEESQRISDEKIAEAHARAARAELESEKLKALFAGRRIGLEQILQLSAAIRDVRPTLDLLIEFQANDPEAFVYANDFIDLFRGAGVQRIRFTGNSYISGMVFGLWLSASDKAVATSIVDAFTAARMPMSVGEIDLSKHLPGNEVAPNLYIFVGPKLPAAIHTTTVNVVNTEEPNI